jgi:hypothetical protein
MTVTLVKPFPATARERRFLDTIEGFLARGGTYTAVMAMIDTISSTDRVAAYQQLLADVVNPVDRELYECGLEVVQGGAA